MYNVSVIISIFVEELLIECLDSILNQSLKNIEIICIYNDNNFSMLDNLSKKDKRIKLISDISTLSDVQGEYVIHISNVVTKDMCQMLFSYSISQNLDILYVPTYDCFIEDNDNENFIITPINFTKFYRKDFFNKEIISLNVSNNIDFFDKSLYSYNNINYVDVDKDISEIVSQGDKSKINYSFLILLKYLNSSPLYHRQEIYELLRKKFKNVDLDAENQLKQDIISKNEYYLDFLLELKLETTDYEVYGTLLSPGNYKISVVIPIYNTEKLIHRTLMSIENQSFNNDYIEVLLINDASEDNTAKIINEYADKYSNIIAVHIRNGSGSAGTPRNIGLKLASAEYVMFLDHDDYFEIDALEKLYSYITKYGCDIVYGTYVLIDEDTPIKFVYPNEKQGFFNSLIENERLIITPPSIWTKLFNKDFLLKNHILFPTILGEDVIFMSKALKNANGIYYLGEDIICYYNLNENSYTNNLSYNYFVEGFTSEEYLFNLYKNWNHKEYYYLRGAGILDYYLNRFMSSELNNDEIRELMPLFYDFCHRLNLLNISPQNQRNKIVFNHVLKKDFDSLIKYKNYKPNKIKVISNRFLNKINKHVFR